MRQINQAGLHLIQSFEGLAGQDPATGKLHPYLDPIGIWTIGWGHAITVNGQFLKGAQNQAKAYSLFPGGITLDQAQSLLQNDLANTCQGVLSAVTVPLTDNQFAALVSFTFNVGIGNLRSSTLLRLLNSGNYAGAAGQFQVWNKAGGKVLPGLVRRRAAEAQLFQAPDTPNN